MILEVFLPQVETQGAHDRRGHQPGHQHVLPQVLFVDQLYEKGDQEDGAEGYVKLAEESQQVG